MPEEENKIRQTLEKLPKAEETTLPKPEEKVKTKPVENKDQVNIPVNVETVPTPQAPDAQEPEVENKEITVKQIEKILSEGLEDAFKKMSPDQQAKFKETGERIAIEIQTSITQGKLNSEELLKKVSNWLKSVPDANEDFVAQDSKIKVDKILALTE